MATTHIMNGTQSAHALVRLLKSSTDPPSIPGPSKIELARSAWSDPSFRAVNKGEVIGEWILTVFAQVKKTRREREANLVTDPIADSRYWTLLGDVLTTTPATARPVKTWLLPLLNRFQLDTLTVELLASHSSQVLSPARAALAVLWPLAEKKIGVDALGECLAAVFDACTIWERVDDDLGWICSAVVGTYRNALSNSGNKKKLSSSFLATHLSSWLRVVCPNPTIGNPSSAKQLQDNIYAAGADTLFSLDALKQSLDTLFDAFSSSPISSLWPVLPRLFASFLSAMHKHRSSLFVAATSTVGGKEEIRKNGMEFVGRFWKLIQGSATLQEGFQAEKWRSVIGVFEIVEKERLFVAHSVRGTHADENHGELALNEARDKAVEMLEDASTRDYRTEEAVLSILLLDVLIRIEYDLIGAALERILSALVNIPSTISHLMTTLSSELLVRVLEYHTKTRTVHTYVAAFLSAVVASCVSTTSWTTIPATWAFPLPHHLPALTRAVRTSLTPTQSKDLAITVLKAVKNTWRDVQDMDEQDGRAVKKRKSTRDTDEEERGGRVAYARARAFSLTNRVAGIVLSNLPPNAYVADGEYSLESLWIDIGKLGWAIVWDCLSIRTGRADGRMAKGGGRKRKHELEAGPSAHQPHAMTAATLRFLYDIRARVSSLLGEYDQLTEQRVRTLLDVALDGASEPELVLEIVRTLFWHMWYTHNGESQKQTESQSIFTATLDILTAHISSKSEWSGVSADVTRDNLGLALLYVLTDRWIDVLDELAPTESLERLVSLLLTVSLDLPPDEISLQQDHPVITLRGVLHKLFQNAQFWELHNIRAVFSSSILTLTAPLSSSLSASTTQTESTLAYNTYGLLCYVPPEYFTRFVRAELIKRAMAADIQICATLPGTDGQGSKLEDRVLAEKFKMSSHRLISIRAFLRRMGQFQNTGHITSLDFVTHLLSPFCIPSPSKALTNVTLDLLQLSTLNLLRSQEPEATTSIARVISALTVAKPFSYPNSQELCWHVIVQSTVLRLMERLTNDFDPASLSNEAKLSLKVLIEFLDSVLSPRAQRLVERESTGSDQFLSSGQINALCRLLSMKRWLGIRSEVVSNSIGLKLATSMIRRTNSNGLDSETCTSILGLLFEELWCMPDDSHRVHLDVLVCFYVANADYRESDQDKYMIDSIVAQASKKLSVEDFSRLLDVLVEGIGGSGVQAGHRERLIHLGKIILHDAPQGTLKAIQNFVTRCFDLFVDREDIYCGSSPLKMQYMECIARHCSDRPVAIRTVDLGNIWSLLHKILSGSPDHDIVTMFPIFHHIITIIGALIRLRRDLVVYTLPHLSLVLRQLTMLIRRIRPQLGVKQSKLVTDTFPSWLCASHPLTTDEARALARLLTSLTTKTVPRTHSHVHPSASAEPRKAESLAKPFAKHASYVLVAYVDAFNDPLCIINAEMRRELEPGLFALCEMVGEHSRDALMVSALDSGGKTILKALWKDYEKQRYVGKG